MSCGANSVTLEEAQALLLAAPIQEVVDYAQPYAGAEKINFGFKYNDFYSDARGRLEASRLSILKFLRVRRGDMAEVCKLMPWQCWV